MTSNQRITIRQLEDEFQLSRDTINVVLSEDLNLSKKAPHWVPKLLTVEQKQTRVDMCNFMKKKKFELGASFLKSIVTMDESLVCFYTPESKKQSKEWLPKGAPAPHKAKMQESRKNR